MEDTKFSRKSIYKNLLWRFGEKTLIQLINVFITIIVARIFDPNDFGVVAISTSIISIISIFVDNGISDALIQKKEPDDLDYSTVFYTNIILSLFIYLILFFLAPFISSVYNNNLLTSIIRVASIKIVLSSIQIVQNAYVSKQMIFKKFFYASLTGTIISGIVGIVLALNGYGVWALVSIELVDIFIDMLVTAFVIDWKPKLVFSFDRLKKLFNYGSKLLYMGIIDSIYSKIHSLAIGKVYSTKDLAFYDKGDNIPRKLTYSIYHSLSSVMRPVFSNKQDDLNELKFSLKKVIKMSSYIIFPILFGVIAISDTFIKVIFTEKWMFSIPYIRIMCIAYLFTPIESLNANVIRSLGKSDILLKNDVITKIIGLLLLLISLRYGVLYIALSFAITNFINMLIQINSNKKIIDYGFIGHIKDLYKILIVNIIMSIAVYLLTFIDINMYIKLLLQVSIGILLYLFLSYIFKLNELNEIIKTIKEWKL